MLQFFQIVKMLRLRHFLHFVIRVYLLDQTFQLPLFTQRYFRLKYFFYLFCILLQLLPFFLRYLLLFRKKNHITLTILTLNLTVDTMFVWLWMLVHLWETSSVILVHYGTTFSYFREFCFPFLLDFFFSLLFKSLIHLVVLVNFGTVNHSFKFP